MNVLYKSPFKKFVKRQNKPFQLVLEDEAERIKNNPDIEDFKKGDLSGFRVHIKRRDRRRIRLSNELQD